MRFLPVIFMFLSACSTESTRGTVFDPNGPVAVAAVDIAQAVLVQETPAVNSAIAELPTDVQAMAQVAFGALQAVLKELDKMQPKSLAVHDPNTVNNTNDLRGYVQDVSNQLDSLIH